MYKILVVDDEPKIREVIKEYAEREFDSCISKKPL